MIGFIIIGALLLIIAAILFLPVSVVLGLKEEIFSFKIKFSGFKVYEPKEDEKLEEPKKISKTESEEKRENKVTTFFKKLKAKYGFLGAFKLLLNFLRDLIPHIKQLLKHIKFRKVMLNITVAENDAAKTAIEYGSVCGIVYPLLSGLQAVTDIKYKKINISSDFESVNSSAEVSGIISTRIFFLLIVLVKVYKEYKKFIARIENDERK